MAGPPMPPPGIGGPMGPGGPPMPPPGMMRKRGGKVAGDVIASGKFTPKGMERGIKGWSEPRAKPKGNKP
jgi:hypothetical protein